MGTIIDSILYSVGIYLWMALLTACAFRAYSRRSGEKCSFRAMAFVGLVWPGVVVTLLYYLLRGIRERSDET